MKSVYTKAMWVGRTTTFAVGLAVILALILGFATTAFAAKGKPVLRNVADQAVTAVTGLKGSLTGAILKLDNDGSGTALQLEVQPGNAPLAVNSEGKVTNLNADKLDGKDSTAFGIKTAHASANAANCDNPSPTTPSTFNECAPVTVTVPAGKQYIVSVWSSFSAKGGANNQDVTYCAAGKGTGIDTANPCVSPFGAQNKVTVVANQFTAAASSGDTVTLTPGTYTFFTAIKPTAEFASPGNDDVITKVLVRDASNSLP